jgi:dephospho-CoA kinase
LLAPLISSADMTQACKDRPPIVLGITGRIGAGKTSAGTYLSRAHGFEYVRYSQVLSDWMAQDPNSKARLQAVGWEVMAGGMQVELNRMLIARIGPNGDCTIDGLRHPLDYESLKDKFASSFFLIYIDCPLELRWQRLRNKPHYREREEFVSADSHPVEQQIDALKMRAHVVVENTRSLQDLNSALDGVLGRIRSGESL